MSNTNNLKRIKLIVRGRVMSSNEGLKILFSKFKKNKNYKEIISNIFEESYKHDKYSMNSTIIGALNDLFKCDSSELIEYICEPDFKSADDIGLADNGIINFINEIKIKYYIPAVKSNNAFNKPFALDDMNITIGKGFSHATMAISRVDGEKLNLSINAQDFINILNSVSLSLNGLLSLGVYNINNDEVKKLIGNLSELTSLLETKIDKE